MATHRAVVIGAGGISRAWFGPLKKEQVEVVAVVDLRAEAAQQRIAEFELAGARACTSLDEALTLGADFAVDLTTPNAHCKVVCAALEAGLAVIGEKPMAETLDQCRQMVETSRRTGKPYMVSQSRRYNNIHQQIAATVRSGRLGRITSMHCDFFMGCHFGGFRDVMDHVLLNDMSIHHFDMARLFIGADPLSVYAEEYLPHGSWYRHGPNANCLFTMTGDIRFTYRGSWCAEGCHTSWTGDWRIIGEMGTLIYAGDQPPRGQLVAGAEGFNRPLAPLEIAPLPDITPGQHGALKEFLAYLDGGPKPQGLCDDNIKSMAMVCEAIRSATEGKRISLV